MRRLTLAARLSYAATIAAGLLAGAFGEATARSLQSIRARGTLLVCANPNALPFSTRTGPRRGFQIELGEAVAAALGVRLEIGWVIFPLQAGRVDCDLVFDAIVDRQNAGERHLRLSEPYRSSGVAIALRPGAGNAARFDDLKGRKVGAIVGSLASVMLGQRGVATEPFTFEDEMVEAVGRGELDAALASPATIGWYNSQHAGAPLTIVHAYRTEPSLSWNVAAGLRKADDALLSAVSAAIARLLSDGSVDRIYARYGVAASPPRVR